MSKNRLEAFSDGIIAIAITIIVLNISIPLGDTWKDIFNIYEQFIIYIISFLIIGVYWINHHHVLGKVVSISKRLLWKNNIFLFFLTLLPLATNWVGKYFFSLTPQFFYGVILLFLNISFLSISKEVQYIEKSKITSFKRNYFSIFINILALFIGILATPVLISILNLFIVFIWLFPLDK